MPGVVLFFLTAVLTIGGQYGRPIENPVVLIKTEMGDLTVEIFVGKAPKTAANFMNYVDAGLYDGTVFHRTVRLDNQEPEEVKIEVIQGGEVAADKSLPPILLERTIATGVYHVDGTISMARGGPNTATSSFFICLGDQPELDFGGKRNKDGEGFAAFGRVTAGMDVVRKIHAAPREGQTLKPPVKIL
ncbi:MAG: peptidylprolyl isomerase, partial [Candidatus Aminicenantes bacterium]|nr:peptidylprolyl isomerase [Candidatus Aminicenantes bacterium]